MDEAPDPGTSGGTPAVGGRDLVRSSATPDGWTRSMLCSFRQARCKRMRGKTRGRGKAVGREVGDCRLLTPVGVE